MSVDNKLQISTKNRLTYLQSTVTSFAKIFNEKPTAHHVHKTQKHMTQTEALR